MPLWHNEVDRNMTLIYKYCDDEIKINFFTCPATLEFSNLTKKVLITINGDYIEGNKKIANKLITWLNENMIEIENIIWEWETGNDNFPLIENKFNI